MVSNIHSYVKDVDYISYKIQSEYTVCMYL